MAKNLDFPTLSQMFLPMVLRWQSGAVLPPSVANGRGCTRIQNKREIRISLTFDCNVRSAVFFSCVLAFTSIFCFSYVSLQYHLLCKLHMHINTCIMWLSMNAVSAVKNHLQMHLVRGYDETYLNCTCCVSTFCNSPSTTVTSESSSRNLLRLFKNVSNSKLKHETFLVLQTSTIYYNTVRVPLSNLGRNLYIRTAVRILQNVCKFTLHVAVKFPSSLAASFFYYSFAMWASFSEQSKSYFEPSTFAKLKCLLNLSTLSFFAYIFIYNSNKRIFDWQF